MIGTTDCADETDYTPPVIASGAKQSCVWAFLDWIASPLRGSQ
jgi:hypothetical protein